MIVLQSNGHRFQLRAAAVVLHDGHLLVHRAEGDEFWTLPGGRVELHEHAAATVVRELHEELGERVQCGELLYVGENFFEHAGERFHELGMFFRVTLDAASPLLDKSRSHAGTEGHLKLEFRWVAQAALPALELYPAFLREALAGPNPSFRHVVEHG